MNKEVPHKEELPDLLRKKLFELNDFNYDLPDEKIAQFPVHERDTSKLLISGDNFITETVFRDIDEFIPAGHLLVFNNTMVVRARLRFQKDTGASIEVFCIEPVSPSGYELSFSSKGEVTWKCIIGNLKKWKKGKLLKRFIYEGVSYELTADKIIPVEDAWEVRFEWNCPIMTFGEILETAGHIPLPPYINREDTEGDINGYQTVYARVKGSVAAPTAGLHFTDHVFEKLGKKGVKSAEITLHVGAGTFQPVKSANIADHDMHSEHFIVSAKTIETILSNTGRIIAVGTTSVRTLESLYWLGIKLSGKEYNTSNNLSIGQWEPYNHHSSYSASASLETILAFMNDNGISHLDVTTKIMIIPGYEFKITNGIITNFHQPGSTLLLLVSAWTGKKWKEIYKYALANDFRFLSYGDCSLLLR